MKTEFIAQVNGEERSHIGELESNSGTTTITVGDVSISAKTRDLQVAFSEAVMEERKQSQERARAEQMELHSRREKADGRA